MGAGARTQTSSKARGAHSEHFDRCFNHAMGLYEKGWSDASVASIAKVYAERGLSDCSDGVMHAVLRMKAKRLERTARRGGHVEQYEIMREFADLAAMSGFNSDSDEDMMQLLRLWWATNGYERSKEGDGESLTGETWVSPLDRGASYMLHRTSSEPAGARQAKHREDRRQKRELAEWHVWILRADGDRIVIESKVPVRSMIRNVVESVRRVLPAHGLPVPAGLPEFHPSLLITDPRSFEVLTTIEGAKWAEHEREHDDDPYGFWMNVEAFRTLQEMGLDKQGYMIVDALPDGGGFLGDDGTMYTILPSGEIVAIAESASAGKRAKIRRHLRLVSAGKTV
jgi:hypothetical protein